MLSFLEFLYEEKNMLDEASLGRFVQHMENNEPFAIISACRAWNDDVQAKNNAATKKLQSDILSAGFGFHKCVGGYVETDPDGKQHEVVDEKSHIVYATKDREKELRIFAFKMGVKYQQNSILFCGSDGKAYWRYTNDFWAYGHKYKKGDTDNLGEFVPRRIGDYFSKIGKKQFTFKSIE